MIANNLKEVVDRQKNFRYNVTYIRSVDQSVRNGDIKIPRALVRVQCSTLSYTPNINILKEVVDR